MFCQNCQTKVDNDLIFCTNCGERISATISPISAQNLSEKPAKSSSNLKWIALIVALLAIPATLFGVYLISNLNQPQTAQNTDKTNSVAKSPTRKTNSNTNSNLDNFHKNVNVANENTNQPYTNTETSAKEVEIINERIEIMAKSSYAKSFTVEAKTAKIVGETEVLQGENIKGFVYLQSQYDLHFPDETYKMFSFGEGKKSVVDATLVKENYVLVFANDSDKSVIIKSKISIK